MEGFWKVAAFIAHLLSVLVLHARLGQHTDMLLAFDPVSLAIAASAVENACQNRRRVVPSARLWLRKHSEPILGAVLHETSDAALETIMNHLLEPQQLGPCLLCLLLLMSQLRRRRPLWALCLALALNCVVS
jgi:hypothetical protein